MGAPIGGPGPTPPPAGAISLDQVGELLEDLGFDVSKTQVKKEGDILQISERGKSEVLVRLTANGDVIGAKGPQNPQLDPPKSGGQMDAKELNKLLELKDQLVTFGVSLADVMLFLSKILSKEKFMNVLMAAELGVESVKMARQIADYKITAKEKDVEAAKLAVAGAAVQIGMAVTSLVGSAFSIAKGAKVKKEMMDNDNPATGEASPNKKLEQNKKDYQNATKDANNPQGKQWDGRQMNAKERQEFDALVTKEQTFNTQHTQWQQRNQVGPDGTVAGGPGGAQAGDVPPVPMRPQEKQRLNELRARDNMERGTAEYNKHEQVAQERSTMEARNIQMMSEQIGHIGQAIGGMMGNIGQIMYAVEAEEWRGIAEVTEAMQKLLQNLAQSLVGPDNQESTDLYKKILEMFEQYEQLKTRISDFRS